MSDTKNVFISHVHEDDGTLQDLKQLLEKNGHSIRDGSIDSSKPNDAKNSFCNYPFRKISISPSGEVVLCCMDYRYETRLGNVNEQHLRDIWQSDQLNRYRLSLLKRDRQGFCAECDVTQYSGC